MVCCKFGWKKWNVLLAHLDMKMRTKYKDKCHNDHLYWSADGKKHSIFTVFITPVDLLHASHTLLVKRHGTFTLSAPVTTTLVATWGPFTPHLPAKIGINGSTPCYPWWVTLTGSDWYTGPVGYCKGKKEGAWAID